MDLQQRYALVLLAEKTITGDAPYYLTSLNNPDAGGGILAGRVFDIPASKGHNEPPTRLAARLIAGCTHRLSTPAEIEKFHFTLKRQTEELAALRQEAKAQFALPDDLKALVKTAALIIEREAVTQSKSTHNKEKS